MQSALRLLNDSCKAVEWYSERLAATKNGALEQLLAERLVTEREIAWTTLDWIRRSDPVFGKSLCRLLFRSETYEVGDANPVPTTRECRAGGS